MHSITSDHFFSAFLMTAGMVALAIVIVGAIVYALYRFFREENDS